MDINTGNGNEMLKELPEGDKHSSTGALIGSIIVIIILIVGGLYFWGKKIDQSQPVPESSTVVVPEDLSATPVETLSDEQLESVISDDNLKIDNVDVSDL